MSSIQDLTQTVDDAREAVKAAQRALDDYEIDTDDADVVRAYEDMLDEAHGDFMGYSASMILKEVDPTAYRCGMNDWTDGLDKSDFDGYRDLQEVLNDAETDLEVATEALNDARDKEEADHVNRNETVEA